MSAVRFYKRLREAGIDEATAILCTEAFEAEATASRPERSSAARRQAAYRARKRNEPVTGDVTSITDITSVTDHNEITPLAPIRAQVVNHSLSSLQSERALTPNHTTYGTAPNLEKPFETFWLAYPNKVAKRKALAAYDKALKRIAGPDPPSQILAGVERAKASRKWIDGYIEHPTTWLNGDCWDDQPAEVIPFQGKPHDRTHRPDPKFDAKQANLARAFAGANRVTGPRPLP